MPSKLCILFYWGFAGWGWYFVCFWWWGTVLFVLICLDFCDTFFFFFFSMKLDGESGEDMEEVGGRHIQNVVYEDFN